MPRALTSNSFVLGSLVCSLALGTGCGEATRLESPVVFVEEGTPPTRHGHDDPSAEWALLGRRYTPVDSPSGLQVRVVDLDAGDQLLCGILAEGSVRCVGGDAFGVPDEIPGEWHRLSVHGAGICAVSADGLANCWGHHAAFTPGRLAHEVSAIALGATGVCVLDRAGLPRCWGRADWPCSDPPSEPLSALSVGNDIACGIRTTDGLVRCWGSTDELPTLIGNGGEVAGVAVAGGTVCLRYRSGVIECHGDQSPRFLPLPEQTRLVNFDVAWASLCGIAESGALVCFGSPVQSPRSFGGGFSDVATAVGYHCALEADTGTATCLGLVPWK